MLDIAKIDQVLKQLAYSGRHRINAHQVAYLSGNQDVNEVYNYMLSRVPYIMERKYEILCPENMDSTMSVNSLDEIPKKWIECRICGEEFIPDEKLIHIVFYFNKSYIDQVNSEVKNEKKLNRQLSLV